MSQDGIREPIDRLAELERELLEALVTMAAIIAKYGDAAGNARAVTLTDAELEQIRREPPTVFREDRPGNVPGFALRLEIRP